MAAVHIDYAMFYANKSRKMIVSIRVDGQAISKTSNFSAWRAGQIAGDLSTRTENSSAPILTYDNPRVRCMDPFYNVGYRIVGMASVSKSS